MGFSSNLTFITREYKGDLKGTKGKLNVNMGFVDKN